ncbi:histidine phosphatase superfamily [Xylariaceae sp. FL0016]|nr:histidine phosphatase superfamily [Xylariaceae sp. FL0016]
MAPVIILIRHAQALHNVDDNWEIFDPKLTAQGIEQCKIMAAGLEPQFPFTKDECKIVVSPLTRTLETVHHGLPWLVNQGVPVQVRAEWQETTDNPCDIGDELSKIQNDWPGFDFSQMDPAWPQKTGLYGPKEEDIQKRAAVCRTWLAEQPEKCIVVVTHSGFLRRLVTGPKYLNVEFRTYVMVDRGAAGGLELTELSKEQPAMSE